MLLLYSLLQVTMVHPKPPSNTPGAPDNEHVHDFHARGEDIRRLLALVLSSHPDSPTVAVYVDDMNSLLDLATREAMALEDKLARGPKSV